MKRQRPEKSPGPSFEPYYLPRKATHKLRELTAPHVESFDFFLKRGFHLGIANVPKYTVDLGENGHISFWLEGGEIQTPRRSAGHSQSSQFLYPRDCREHGIMYTGAMTANLCYKRSHSASVEVVHQVKLGGLPIMVMSSHCHLRNLTPKELVQRQEEDCEMGGYFIVNGIERCIRLLQVPRRNYPAAIQRPSFKKRGRQYSDKGVIMRCVGEDQLSASMTLHYLNNGAVTLRITVRKAEYLLPTALVLRALTGMSDKEIYKRIVIGQEDNTFLCARAEALLQVTAALKLSSQSEALSYIGSRFRQVFPDMASHSKVTGEQVGRAVLDRYIAIHVKDYYDKAGAIFLCLSKLYAFVEGRCLKDNADAMSSLEILLPGHLISAFVREKLDEGLQAMRQGLLREVRADGGRGALAAMRTADNRWVRKLAERFLSSVGTKVATMLSTGNIISSTGLDLMQVSGFTIVAERLNFLRYLSHFRSVHRGQFFTTMKTTTVRKLLPESWGFLCPVHTPDGSPCGLLNHMATTATVLSWPTDDSSAPSIPIPGMRYLKPQENAEKRRSIEEVCARLGMVPASSDVGCLALPTGAAYIPVVLDGRFLGSCSTSSAVNIVNVLRRMKVESPPAVDPTLEVAYFSPRQSGLGPYAGLFLASAPGRMVRPVLQRASGKIELLGPLEQTHLEIACLPEEIHESTTHQELDPTNMLSLIASLTPFSDQNQSPRNMYQCQMGKQTMGTPAHSLPHRTDNKLYKIHTPQAPIVQTRRHAEYQLDEYPQGTNAVVAVISYTGFDMEDAMILNKASFERGFAHGSIYKTKTIDLDDEEKKAAVLEDGTKPTLRFGNTRPTNFATEVSPSMSIAEVPPLRKVYEGLDVDGLPLVGKWYKQDEPMYCLVNATNGETHVTKHKDAEEACVQTVRLLGSEGRYEDKLRRVSLTLRIPRNPIIGDKFSSRHGQKGVMSVLWPQEDMPFSESGISPDVIINPHAFPSRMTIGMLVESMAGKSGSLHGMYQDATPFQFSEKETAVDYFGEQLRAAGYSYWGSEPMYSGLSGLPLQVDIFLGVVYYQRLRHMVSDKSQVRATGGVNPVTRQPVKGRKRGGGIRFGEMERDSLISHGTAFLLHDRLMNCSDRHIGHVCRRCGSLLSPCPGGSNALVYAGQGEVVMARALSRFGKWVCSTCGPDAKCEAVSMPYVFRYLVNELAALGVKVSLSVDQS